MTILPRGWLASSNSFFDNGEVRVLEKHYKALKINHRFLTLLDAAFQERRASAGRLLCSSDFRKPLAARPVSWLLRRIALSLPCAARTFWGGRMIVVVPESVSTQILRFGFTEFGLSRFLVSILQPGMVFYDVGAHYGYYSLMASKLVGANGRVHAFEASAANFFVLLKNVSSQVNVTAVNLAIWQRDNASLRFFEFPRAMSAFSTLFKGRGPSKGQGRARDTVVATMTLDTYQRTRGQPPDVVKIDVESAEYEVLAGMISIMRNYAPIVTIEVGRKEGTDARSSRDCVKLAESIGYGVFEYHGESLREHTLREDYSYDNLILIPDSKRAFVENNLAS